ncbi:MAG: hypothetical protein ACAI34_24400 [Verrucomicrobium sp.]|nr:hypothetical protein [Verrucomicrobium sp.]
MTSIRIPKDEAWAVRSVLEMVAPELAETFHSSVVWKSTESETPDSGAKFLAKGKDELLLLKCSDEFLEMIMTAIAQGQSRLAPETFIDDMAASELPSTVDQWIVVWNRENGESAEVKTPVTAELQAVNLP